MSVKTYQDESSAGEFKRAPSQCRGLITADGSSGYKTEAGRYHLYVSGACPWCSRVVIAINLKGLTDVIDISYVDPVMGEIGPDRRGWHFTGGEYKDPLLGKKTILEVYLAAIPDYNGKPTVPLLWDKKTSTIVSNESSDMLKFINSEFNSLAKNATLDYRPAKLLKQIEEVGDVLYDGLNNGVYRCGFATTQKAYDEAVTKLFKTLDYCEEILSKNRYFLGETFTEVDIRAYVTFVRFDPVYFVHFKCSLKRLEEYKNISNYLRELYQLVPFKHATRLDEIRNHYFQSHRHINPYGIVAVWGGEKNFEASHNRTQFKGATIPWSKL